MSEHDKLPLDRDALDHIAECIRSHGVNVPPVGDATMFALVDQSHAAISLAAALSAARREGAQEAYKKAEMECEVKVQRESGYGGRWEGYGAHMGDRTGPECAAAIRALAEREVRP